MKKSIISVFAIVVSAAIAGFIYLPSLFEAKYEGPTITVADGIQLVTFVRLPEGDGPFPALIVRSPYELPHTPLAGLRGLDFTNIENKDLGRVGWPEVTEAGYALVIQHTRGRIGSEGVALDFNERADALELIEWVKEQPWSNGKIGTTGDSIEAIMAMMMNSEAPDLVDASFAQIGTPNLINEAILGPGGALKLETFLPWAAEQVLTADDHHYKELGFGPIKRRTARIQMGFTLQQVLSGLENPHDVEAWKHLPLIDYPHFANALPAWNEILEAQPHSEIAKRFDSSVTDVPSFYVAAWFDVFAPSQISSFERAEARNAEQRMLILNGTHFSPEDPGAWPIQPMLPWFDYHLKGETSALMDLPRVIFPIANGDNEWYGAKTWPPAPALVVQWHLSKSGGVSNSSDIQAGKRGYAYDPENPVPTIGGRNLMISHGALDQGSVREGQRADVLSYDSVPLEDDVVVMGHLYGKLSVSSDAPDTDFTVKIMDISPDGTATLITEGIQRARFREGLDKQVFMKPGEVYQLSVDLGHIAWRFKPGHRIAVDISSSNFPQWDRNLNTDQPLYSSTDMKTANNIVHHGGKFASFIELPIVSDLGQLERLPDFRTSVSD